jgi:hypothetical protein
MSGARHALVALVAAGTLALLAPACTFVKMGPGGQDVRVVAPGRMPAGCEKRGEVEVSVKDRLGPYERDALRVSDELETLARNEAPSLNADTVQAKGPPVDGAQRWLAFRCGPMTGQLNTAPMPVDPTPPPTESEATTTPLKQD